MKWIKASERLPEMEKALYLKHNGGVKSLGNFYEQDGCYIIYFQRNGAHEEYEKLYYSGVDIEWLDESEGEGNELAIVDAVKKWMGWTVDNFPKSGAKAALIHLQEEIKEVIEAMESDVPTPISEEGVPLMEYADCMICLLTAAGKSGFTIEELFRAIKNKMNINYTRKWVLNDDNTYSHVPNP